MRREFESNWKEDVYVCTYTASSTISEHISRHLHEMVTGIWVSTLNVNCKDDIRN